MSAKELESLERNIQRLQEQLAGVQDWQTVVEPGLKVRLKHQANMLLEKIRELEQLMRVRLQEQIERLPSDLLPMVAEFVESLSSKPTKTTDSTPSPTQIAEADEPVLKGSTGADLLPFIGTWQGDDLEDCLQAVYETRSQAEF